MNKAKEKTALNLPFALEMDAGFNTEIMGEWDFTFYDRLHPYQTKCRITFVSGGTKSILWSSGDNYVMGNLFLEEGDVVPYILLSGSFVEEGDGSMYGAGEWRRFEQHGGWRAVYVGPEKDESVASREW